MERDLFRIQDLLGYNSLKKIIGGNGVPPRDSNFDKVRSGSRFGFNSFGRGHAGKDSPRRIKDIAQRTHKLIGIGRMGNRVQGKGSGNFADPDQGGYLVFTRCEKEEENPRKEESKKKGRKKARMGEDGQEEVFESGFLILRGKEVAVVRRTKPLGKCRCGFYHFLLW
jgi:hypothetical protein